MMFTRSRSVLTILLCAFALAAGAFAQTSSTTGEIAGRVVDDSDAVLPGVAVTAANVNTGLSRTAVTGGNGD